MDKGESVVVFVFTGDFEERYCYIVCGVQFRVLSYGFLFVIRCWSSWFGGENIGFVDVIGFWEGFLEDVIRWEGREGVLG